MSSVFGKSGPEAGADCGYSIKTLTKVRNEIPSLPIWVGSNMNSPNNAKMLDSDNLTYADIA